MKLYRIQDPFLLTIFGASGDLAKLKLFPALYSLMEQHRLPKDFYVVGFARSAKTQTQFKKDFEQAVRQKFGKEVNPSFLKTLLSKVFYFRGQYDQIFSYRAYRQYLQQVTKGQKLTHIAYCSVPPQAFKPIIQRLGETKLAHEDLRLVIEKPFGQDLPSANDLFHFLARYFDEDHVYLLDHYLGKSAVQSILSLRHSNRILNHMLKGSQIANIQITAFEDTGVSTRIGYFDQVGIIKDMVQSHLLQLLALITMSIPITETASSLHREKTSILAALNFPRSPRNIVIGQYESYKKEPEVPKNSKTETFVALRLFIDRESWYKIPIYIRAGKQLREKHTYIVIEFKKFAFQPKNEEPNLLILELYPDEKLSIKLVNQNGVGASGYRSVSTSDSIACVGDDCLPEHGLLLLDIIRGSKDHFLCFPEIIAGWNLVEALLSCLKKNKKPLEIYKNNSAGPVSQNQLTAVDSFEWHDPH